MKRNRLFPFALTLGAAVVACHASADVPPFRAVSFAASIAPIADGHTPRAEWGRRLTSDGSRVLVGVRSANFGIDFLVTTGCAEIWEFDSALATRGWRRAADLQPPEGLTALDGFGSALAIDGDVAAVGIPRRASDGVANSGAVFLYRRGADGAWSHVQTLTAATPVSGEFFGSALAMHAGVLLVGVPGRANGGGATLFVPDARGVYGDGVPFNVPGSTSSGDWGEVVALDGEVALVGDTQAKVGALSVGGLASFALNGPATPTFESVVFPPPTDQASGVLFGYHLNLDDGLLAVASPNFNQNRGAVYTFRRMDGGWTSGPSVYGASVGTRLGSVDVHDGLLAIGSEAALGSGMLGMSWLYRVDEQSLVLLASETAATTNRRFGAAVALLDEWWFVCDASLAGPDKSPWLWGQYLGDVAGDCDGNGVPNAVEVRLGGADDCDGNLVPTSCEIAANDCDKNGTLDACQIAPVTVSSTTAPPNGITFYNASAPLGVFLCRVNAPSDATSILGIGGQMHVFSDTSDVPSYIALYHDPLGADVPSNLTALAAWSTRFPMSRQPFEVALDPVPVVPDGRYYVAFVTGPADLNVAPLLASQGNPYVPFTTYYGSSSTDVFDPVEIGASTVFGDFAELAGIDLNITAFARFATVEDANADGVPDACACPADLDGDGAIGPKDLALLLGAWGSDGGDVSGDGTTDAADLGVLLGGWGPCG